MGNNKINKEIGYEQSKNSLLAYKCFVALVN